MTSPVDYLISTQDESGGWGYMAGNKPVVEPTAVALLALRGESNVGDCLNRGIIWLTNCQHADGGWGINDQDPESGWQTAWALIALQRCDQSEIAISKAEDWLMAVDTMEISREQFLESSDLNSKSLIGSVWPWLPGQAGWIEPTAMAVLALQQKILESKLVSNRIKAAFTYFAQYRTPDGGWNIGNATSIDTVVLPRAYPTSLVLLALTHTAKQDTSNNDVVYKAQQGIQPKDLSALQQDLSLDDSILAQSSALLALRTLGKDDDALNSAIVNRQLANGSWENSPFFTAWAALAMRGYL